MSGVVVCALLLQATPPEGLIMAMALSYGLSLLGMLLAWRNYRKRRGGKTPPSGPSAGEDRHEEKREP